MPKKKSSDADQHEAFKAAARELEREHGGVAPEDFDKLLGSVGRNAPKTEAEARKEEGKPPRQS